ncbi:MAG: acyl-CoA dehydrogenase [bacterium TMED88]|nr:acyl-CoA dehydrogenase [Deltaproteobacteria bacterium]OUV34173.1 MAG: acyl-CoA dehydrogenase [bacterium TMED88]
MRRDVFTEEHEMFRSEFRRFAETELAPRVEKWNADGVSDRETWLRMGEAGFLGVNVAEVYGGAGGDFLFSAIVLEELARIRAWALQVGVHCDTSMPYLTHFGSDEQKERYLPPAVRGELLIALALTEPAAGSDLAGIQTRALREGDHYVLNGSKTFISHGQTCGMAIVAAKSDPKATPPHAGVSLFLVDADTPGFRRGRNLEKLGFKGQDTSELFFDDCRVAVANRLGAEGAGFKMLMSGLQQERLVIAVQAIAGSRRSLDDTIAYVKERKAFGESIASFQNTQFKLAELATEVEVGQAFIDQLLVAHVRGEGVVTEVSMAKWWASALQKRLSGECLQLFGGYGFMREYPISQDYADAAVPPIYGGSNEIMKVIIARSLGLG